MQLPAPEWSFHIINPVGAMDTRSSFLNVQFILLCLCLISYKWPNTYGLVGRQTPNNAIKKKN